MYRDCKNSYQIIRVVAFGIRFFLQFDKILRFDGIFNGNSTNPFENLSLLPKRLVRIAQNEHMAKWSPIWQRLRHLKDSCEYDFTKNVKVKYFPSRSSKLPLWKVWNTTAAKILLSFFEPLTIRCTNHNDMRYISKKKKDFWFNVLCFCFATA